jgi:SPP1 gp7 family putative phage head morphogenesis protein
MYTDNLAVYKVRRIGEQLRKNADLEAIRRGGYRYYRVIAERDERLCRVCNENDGKVYPISEAKEGVNLPPFHPNCRCSIERAFGINTNEHPGIEEMLAWQHMHNSDFTREEKIRILSDFYGFELEGEFLAQLEELYGTLTDGSASDELPQFLDALGFRESTNNYSAENGQYMGKYQMGYRALEDIGFVDSSRNWTAKAAEYGVTSRETFLGNVRAQEAAMRMFMDVNWRYIRAYGLDEFIGQTMNGILITESGLLAMLHLIGIGHVRDALRNGDLSELADYFGTEGLEYLENFGGFSLERYQK